MSGSLHRIKHPVIWVLSSVVELKTTILTTVVPIADKRALHQCKDDRQWEGHLALYHHLNEDNSPVDGRRVCKAGRRLSQPTAHSGSKGSTFTVRMWTKPSNNLAKNVFLAEHPKTSFWAKKWCVDFLLGDNSHKTLTLPVDLAHLLPRPPRCHPKQVVCPHSENV